MVTVSPLTDVTVPNRTGNCTSMLVAVVELEEESWIPTCCPTARADEVIVVGPSLNVVAEVMAYVVDVPARSLTVMDVDETAVMTPPSKSPIAGGAVEGAVVASWAVWVDAADAMPTPPAARPTPRAVVAATRFSAFFLVFMMCLSFRPLETISSNTIVANADEFARERT
jgi:hypothetical protein